MLLRKVAVSAVSKRWVDSKDLESGQERWTHLRKQRDEDDEFKIHPDVIFSYLPFCPPVQFLWWAGGFWPASVMLFDMIRSAARLAISSVYLGVIAQKSHHGAAKRYIERFNWRFSVPSMWCQVMRSGLIWGFSLHIVSIATTTRLCERIRLKLRLAWD